MGLTGAATGQPKTTSVRITDVWSWTPTLFSFRSERPAGFRFAAGQFARLGVSSQGPGAPPDVWRAYSMVSGPFDEHLEFYSVVVPGGAFTSRLSALRVGDPLHIELQAHGFLTLDRFPLSGDLWMLGSGTGLAPFLSLLGDPQTWESFDRIVLVHSVRFTQDLAYAKWLAELAEHPIFGPWASKLRIQPVVTREHSNHPSMRVPELITSGALEDLVGCALTPERSKIMLCGNPEMVRDCRNALKSMGFTSARRDRLGQIATENYW